MPTIIDADLTLDVCPLSCGEHHRLGPPPSKHHRCGFSNPLPATMTSRVSTIIGADLTLDVCPLSWGEHHRLGPPPSKHHRCGSDLRKGHRLRGAPAQPRRYKSVLSNLGRRRTSKESPFQVEGQTMENARRYLVAVVVRGTKSWPETEERRPDTL